jgi:hypothetical protein
VKGRGFTRGLVGRDWATSVSKRDNAKDGGLPKHLLDFFLAWVFRLSFYCGCSFFSVFLFSYLAFWAPPFYCNSSWIGTFERCILVRKEYGGTIRRKQR